MSQPIPFPHTQTHIIGQPFTLHTAWCPVNMTLTCNCGGVETSVTIVGSVSAACPSCRRVYNAGFNPTTGKMEMSVGVPQAEQVPS